MGLNMISLAHDETFKSCMSSSELSTEVESGEGLRRGDAHDYL